MKTRKLGNRGLEVSALGMGCMNLSFGTGPAADQTTGIGFVPWGPLGTGFLTGTIDPDTKFDSNTDLRANFPRFTTEAMKANMPVVEMLRNFAKKKNANPVQIALAWLLAQKPWIVPIPGMDKTEYIDDNLKSLDLELTGEDLQEIDSELSKINVQGARLDEGLLSMSED